MSSHYFAILSIINAIYDEKTRMLPEQCSFSF
jgi:hypothetical protein